MNDNNNLYSPPESDVKVSKQQALASRWVRLGASLLDTLLLVIILFPIMYFFGFWENAASTDISMVDTVLYALLGILIYFILNGYLIAKYGQSIGKNLFGTKVVSVETGEILSLGKYFSLRYLPLTILANIPVIGQSIAFVDSLFIFRSDKRCIHDLIAGTKVVNVSKN
ncbi:RDD family protein [Aliikangiella sp. IMCC44359]|uniref:RDD family protein n=1 Tax=Aliikangiella sp. IMCC44359 TaxID=3459125 RepID=UPI00403ABEF6